MKTVFLSASGSIVKWAYTDIINNENIEYCDYPYNFKTGIRQWIFTRKAAKLTPFFIKKILYRKYLKYDFLKTYNKNEVVLFIFTCQYNMFFDTFFETFIKFLKRCFPKSRYAFYYNDLIDTCYPECLDMIKQEFDMVLTFDKIDAQKYGLEYYGEIYSKNELNDDEIINPFDVFFVGSDRGRFDTILELFKKVSDANLSAIFYIFDILKENKDRIKEFIGEPLFEDENKVIYKNSTIYKNVYCPYKKTLALINASKCIAEITLSQQRAATLRLLESVVYGKKLITNCKSAIEKTYYRENNIFVFDDINKIDSKKSI
jgi:hypothetical protein